MSAIILISQLGILKKASMSVYFIQYPCAESNMQQQQQVIFDIINKPSMKVYGLKNTCDKSEFKATSTSNLKRQVYN